MKKPTNVTEMAKPWQPAITNAMLFALSANYLWPDNLK